MAIWWSETDRDANNWDLHAVVRGCSFYTSPTIATSAAATIDPFSSSRKEEEGVDIGESDEQEAAASTTKNAIHELEELCKPFFPKPNIQQLPRESIGSSSSTAPFPKPNIQQVPRESIGTTAPSSKRRKKQQTKKVVCQFPAGRTSSDSDMWAWRKYGQKPIKGSPYPRGYYKCSSSKGCMARKQVERSRTDPSMLVIAYSAEHDHPPPTRRNSLAGSTRNKLPPSSVSDGGSQ